MLDPILTTAAMNVGALLRDRGETVVVAFAVAALELLHETLAGAPR
jgi:hypothetical protein